MSRNARIGLVGILAALVVAALYIRLTMDQQSTATESKAAKSQSAAPVKSGRQILVGKDYAKIQDAINAAKSGDTIQIAAGIYQEPLSITHKNSINLAGVDVNAVIIQCDLREAPVLTIKDCNNIRVEQLTFKHFNPVEREDDAENKWTVVQIENSSVSMKGAAIYDSRASGIRIENDEESKQSQQVTISNCTVYDNRGFGIIVSGWGRAEINNNIVTNNKRNGIYFLNQSGGSATGNICTKNGTNGISVNENAIANVASNTCCENKWSGIWLGSRGPLNVSDNTCNDNGMTGIEIDSKIKVIATGNHCERNGINGIYFRNGAFGNARNNFCSKNTFHGISIDQYSRPDVSDNNCCYNKACGIYDDGVMLGQNKIHDNGEFSWHEIQILLRAGDFNELEYMASKIRNEKRRYTNGSWQLEDFYWAFEKGYGSKDWLDDNIKNLQKWIAQYPASITPRIGLAIAFNKQGWQIRGSRLADTVAPKAWEPFEQKLSKALDVLMEAEKLKGKDPELYATWISVAMGLHKLDDIEIAFKKGIAIEPTYYPLYLNRGFAYLERWYGSPGQYEQLAREAVELTKSELGQSFYFIFAKQMTKYVDDVNGFNATGFNYARIKQGQEDIVKRFPKIKNMEFLNRACFMACAAGNKEDARDYFMDIGNQWQKNVWKNAETFEKYKSWARSKEVAKIKPDTKDANSASIAEGK